MQNFLERYSRTILLQNIDFEGQRRLSETKILMCGAGGISSGIIPILVSSGIKEITIWEGDTLELSNLQRQFIYQEKDLSKPKVELAKKFANSLNSEVKINANQKMLSFENMEEFLKQAEVADIIVDGTDSFISRCIANEVAIKAKKPFFTGSAISFEGQVYSFKGHESETPCYSCLFGADSVTFKEEKTCTNSGVLPAIPSLVGTIIAGNILSYIMLQKLNFSKFILIDFLKEKYFKEIIIKKDPLCKICSTL